MGDRTTVSIEVRQDDRDLMFKLLESITPYEVGPPDEEYSYGQTTTMTFYECNYGWDSELNRLSQHEKCPPFNAYTGDGNDYDPERFIFIGGKLYSHVCNREDELILTVDRKGISYDAWGYIQLFLEVQEEFWDYVLQYKESV